MNGKTIMQNEITRENVRIYHPFGPLYCGRSHVLILGSFPSVKSREQAFFYGHPQNRFWKVIAALFPEVMNEIQGEGPDTRAIQEEEGIRAPSMPGNDPSLLTQTIDYRSPVTIQEKKELILRSGLALWDSIASCEITGSSDASIRNAEPNDLRVITESCDIRAIYCNGKKSLEVYNRYILPMIGREAQALPSTSPANAAWNLERLIEAWSVIRADQ